MIPFEKNHPLHEFNEYFYIDSSKPDLNTYIFKFNGCGAQVVLNKQNINEPFAIVYYLIFDDDYYWYYDKTKTGMIIHGVTVEDVLIAVKRMLRRIKNGKK